MQNTNSNLSKAAKIVRVGGLQGRRTREREHGNSLTVYEHYIASMRREPEPIWSGGTLKEMAGIPASFGPSTVHKLGLWQSWTDAVQSSPYDDVLQMYNVSQLINIITCEKNY